MQTHRGQSHTPPWRDEETLRDLYWAEGLSQFEVADKLGTSQHAIKTAMRDFGIPARYNLSEGDVSYRTEAQHGYEQIKVSVDGATKTVHVHQLVAIREGADPHKVFSSGTYNVHHKNGVQWDNRPDNLECVSSKEHSERHDYIEISRSELLDAIHRYVESTGRAPTSQTTKEWDGPSVSPYRREFGKFTNAIREAGYTPRYG